jgi:hypothetical protein
LKGYGFSVLNRPRNNNSFPLLTIEGQLDNDQDALVKYDKLIAQNHLGVISFRINQNACKKTLMFMKEYKQKTAETKLAGNKYGFGAAPENFEGAGCASFVETLLLKSNINLDIIPFERIIHVPSFFLGNPETGEEVSIFKLLFNSKDINKKGIGDVRLNFPDPQVLFDYLQGVSQDKIKNQYKLIYRKQVI